MGFDDSLAINDVEEKVLGVLTDAGSLCYYVDTEMMTKERLERDEEQVAYNGYSLTYHMIHPLMTVFRIGSSPWEGNDELAELGKQFTRLRTREMVLTHMLDHGRKTMDDPFSDAFVKSLREQIALAAALAEEVRSATAAAFTRILLAA